VAVVVLALIFVPLAARAQDCAGGRVATSEGYCCWPGQRWDDADQRCEGPPSCPAPLSASGSECVGAGVPAAQPAPAPPDMVSAEGNVDYGAAPAAAPASTVVPPTGEIGSGWPSTGQVPPIGSRNPHRATRSDETLQIVGSVILGAGYAADLVGSPFAFATSQGVDSSSGGRGFDTTCHDAIAASMLVPIVGGFFAWGYQQNCMSPSYIQRGGVAFRTGWGPSDVGFASGAWAALGAITAGVQLVGLGLLIVGSLRSMQVTVYDSPSAELSVGPMLGGAWGGNAMLRF
jgi:hypothetical protein